MCNTQRETLVRCSVQSSERIRRREGALIWSIALLSSLESEGNSELQKNSQAEGDSEVFGTPLFWKGSKSGTESVAKTTEKNSMIWESVFCF